MYNWSNTIPWNGGMCKRFFAISRSPRVLDISIDYGLIFCLELVPYNTKICFQGGLVKISRVHFFSFSLLLTCGEMIHELLTPDIIHVICMTKMGYIFLLFRDVNGTGISKYSVNNSAYQIADGLLPCKLMMKRIKIQMI